MISETLRRIYRRDALPVTLVMLLLLSAAWILLRWRWLEISVVGCGFVAAGQVLFNDMAYDESVFGRYAPGWLKFSWSWVQMNAPMVCYPVGAVAVYVLWSKAGWVWLLPVAGVTGVAFVLEVVVFVVSRRSSPHLTPQHLSRMLLSSIVSLGLDLTILIHLLTFVVFLPVGGVTVLRWGVLIMAVAVLVDVRAVYRNRRWWPWRP
jgi:hypothetical protein